MDKELNELYDGLIKDCIKLIQGTFKAAGKDISDKEASNVFSHVASRYFTMETARSLQESN